VHSRITFSFPDFPFFFKVSGGRIKRELSQRALESGGMLHRGRSMQGVVDPEDGVDAALHNDHNNDFDVWGDVGSLPSSQRTSMTRGTTNLLEYNQSNDPMFVRKISFYIFLLILTRSFFFFFFFFSRAFPSFSARNRRRCRSRPSRRRRPRKSHCHQHRCYCPT
jgi:hypothetical protein